MAQEFDEFGNPIADPNNPVSPPPGGGGGGSQVSSTGALPAAKSAAPAASWYNVQSFLGANQPEGAKLRQGAENKAGEYVAGVKESAQPMMNEFKTTQSNIPVASVFNPGKMDTYSEGEITGGFNQSYTPVDYSQYKLNMPDTLQKAKTGDLESAQTYFGENKKQKSTGARSMESALMGSGASGADWLNQFIPGVQKQYQEQVSNPYEASRTSAEAASGKAASDTREAKKGWERGLGDYSLQTEGAIDQALGNMSAAYDAELNKDVYADTLAKAGPVATYDTGLSYAGHQEAFADWLKGKGVGNYATWAGGEGPTREQAAYRTLGGTDGGMQKFNTIQGLLGRNTIAGVKPADQVGWKVDPAALVNEYNLAQKGVATANLGKEFAGAGFKKYVEDNVPLNEELAKWNEHVRYYQQKYDEIKNPGKPGPTEMMSEYKTKQQEPKYKKAKLKELQAEIDKGNNYLSIAQGKINKNNKKIDEMKAKQAKITKQQKKLNKGK